MQLFCVKPKIDYYETFADFAKDFCIRSTDLLLTEKLIYDLFAKDLQLPCHVLLRDDYDMGEPKEEFIDQMLKDLRSVKIDRIIAVGGGSVIDTAKVMSVRNAYPVANLMKGKTPVIIEKELVVIPSTCGTGSEVTFGGIVTMKENGLKTAIMDEKMSSSHAVLIPEVIKGLPLKVFTHCSIDALGHSMESYVSATRGNEFSRAMGGQAVSMILDGYADMIVNGPDYRQNILKKFIQASCMGGMAVNNGGAGPVHALAYPLGEVCHMSHGESIYQFLTAVFEFYQKSLQGDPVFERLVEIISVPLKKAGLFTSHEEVFTRMEIMMNKVYPSRPLHEAGMKESDIEPFADSIMKNKQRLIVASPVSFTKDDAIMIYRKRF